MFLAAAPQLLLCQMVPLPPGDPVHAAEIHQRALREKTTRQELAVQARQQDYQHRFTAKFNQLVDAVAGFSKRYNEGQGTVWPRQEAEKLRKAMLQLQQVEKSLRGEPEEVGAGR
jgi:hypothetical protein